MNVASIDYTEIKQRERYLPGEEGIWIFILGDMLVFTLFFGVYMYYRDLNVELFTVSQSALNQHYGAINTILLLTSSWFVVMGLHSIRSNVIDKARRYFGAALFCGFGFSAVKVIEYSEKISQGIYLNSNDFFMYYYIFTAIHFLHLIIGMLVLGVIIAKCRSNTSIQSDIKIVESGAAYWHLVDLLWIVLFPLIYLVR